MLGDCATYVRLLFLQRSSPRQIGESPLSLPRRKGHEKKRENIKEKKGRNLLCVPYLHDTAWHTIVQPSFETVQHCLGRAPRAGRTDHKYVRISLSFEPVANLEQRVTMGGKAWALSALQRTTMAYLPRKDFHFRRKSLFPSRGSAVCKAQNGIRAGKIFITVCSPL